MRVVMYLGGELVQEIFLLGECFLFEGCSEEYLYLFFLYTLFLHCDSKPCTHFDIYIYIYIEVVITFFHLSLHVLFLFFLYAHASYLLYAIFYISVLH